MRSRTIYSKTNQPMWVGVATEVPTWHIGQQAVAVTQAMEAAIDSRQIVKVSQEFLDRNSNALSWWACNQFVLEIQNALAPPERRLSADQLLDF